ncbi:MAG TPA: (deoxy)nucleoside triphosphate pyrophosphohydrolase [Geobacteraceae bacterium]
MYPLLVTAALLEEDGKVLIARRKVDVPYPLYWEFPGGKVEPDEAPQDAIVREIREELGIDVAVQGVYDVIYHRYPERTVLVIVYRCRQLAGTIENLEVTAHQWVLPRELCSYQLLPADLPLVRRLVEEINAGPAGV